MTPADLVPIGTFAEATRLTVKALRHYHDVGVLEPAWVDPSSRYRYYAWSQVPDAICISTLRDLGIPLERVRRHLREGVPLAEVLAGERERLRAQAARAEQVLAMIEALDERDAGHGTPEVVAWAERRTLLVTDRVGRRSLDAVAVGLVATLVDQASRHGVDTAQPVIGEFPLTLDGSAVAAVHLPVPTRWSAPPGVGVGRLPAGRVARTVHVGPHVSLALGYAGLLRWVEAEGLSPAGRVYEAYLDDPAAVEASDLRTEIALALEPDR